MRDLLRLLLPLLLWLASFSAIYGLHGLGCALRWPEVALPLMSLFRWLLLIFWLAALLAQLGLFIGLRSERFGSASGFVRRTSLALSGVAVLATLWTLHPLALLRACDTG